MWVGVCCWHFITFIILQHISSFRKLKAREKFSYRISSFGLSCRRGQLDIFLFSSTTQASKKSAYLVSFLLLIREWWRRMFYGHCYQLVCASTVVIHVFVSPNMTHPSGARMLHWYHSQHSLWYIACFTILTYITTAHRQPAWVNKSHDVNFSDHFSLASRRLQWTQRNSCPPQINELFTSRGEYTVNLQCTNGRVEIKYKAPRPCSFLGTRITWDCKCNCEACGIKYLTFKYAILSFAVKLEHIQVFLPAFIRCVGVAIK